MASNSGNPKPRKAKSIFICGTLFCPKSDYPEDYEKYLHWHINQWLGYKEEGVPNVEVKITQIEYNKAYRFDFHREYGQWYRFCESSDQNTTIFSLDEQIILAEGYQEGTYADFSTFEGRYCIYHDIVDFTKKYKEAGKEMGASRIKRLEYQQIDRDNISITVYL